MIEKIFYCGILEYVRLPDGTKLYPENDKERENLLKMIKEDLLLWKTL